MPLINIAGTQIQFPDSATSPNWAEPVVQFAEAVAAALSAVSGPFDISPQVYDMVASVNTNVDIPNLSFPPSEVRSSTITYAIFRDPDTAISGNIVVESGTIIITYSDDALVGEKWIKTRQYEGDASVTFSVTDVGQVQFSSTSIGSGTHEGRITYSAKSLLRE